MAQQYMKIPELAKELVISEDGLRRRVRSGELDTVHPGRDHLVTPEGIRTAREKYGLAVAQ